MEEDENTKLKQALTVTPQYSSKPNGRFYKELFIHFAGSFDAVQVKKLGTVPDQFPPTKN